MSAYLRKHSDGSPVFCLRDEEGTFELAQQHARATESFRDTWQVEQSNAQIRKDSHWVEVQRKQALTAEIRVKVQTQQVQETAAQEVYDQRVQMEKVKGRAVQVDPRLTPC